MNPKKVISFIEGEPFISVIPVELGFTNKIVEKEGQRVVGFYSENVEINEILNRAIFYVSRLISSQKERDFKNTKRTYIIADVDAD